MPSNPRKFDGASRPDETPATFTDLKPPGYWSATLGYFVPVRELSDEEFAAYMAENDTYWDCVEADRRKKIERANE